MLRNHFKLVAALILLLLAGNAQALTSTINIALATEADGSQTSTISGELQSGTINDGWSTININNPSFMVPYTGAYVTTTTRREMSYRFATHNITLVGDKYGYRIQIPISMTSARSQWDTRASASLGSVNGPECAGITIDAWNGAVGVKPVVGSRNCNSWQHRYPAKPNATSLAWVAQNMDFTIGNGGLQNIVNNLQLPADTYRWNGLLTEVSYAMTSPAYDFQYNQLYFNIAYTKKGSIKQITLPTTANFDVSYLNGNAIGKTQILGNINGSLGDLTVTPLSANGGSLALGGSRIPYDMEIMAVNGKEKGTLIKNGQMTSVTYTAINAKDSLNFPIEIDANFNVPSNTLTNGLYTDTVTLVFSTTL